MFLLVTCVACGPEVTLDFDADAETYVRAWCEDRAAKYEECVPVVEQIERPFILEECIEDELEFDDPCFAEEIEFGRCRLERLSCEEYLDVQVDTRPGSVCYDSVVAAGRCRANQPSPPGG